MTSEPICGGFSATSGPSRVFVHRNARLDDEWSRIVFRTDGWAKVRADCGPEPGDRVPCGFGNRASVVRGSFSPCGAHASLWTGKTTGRPLWKGESFDRFDAHGWEERRCPASAEALERTRKPRPGAGSLVAKTVDLATRRDAVTRTAERARIAFRDVSRATDTRTVRAALVPPQTFLTNKAPYLAFVEDDPRAEAACLALMNSLALDWQARRFVEINLNFFILEGLYLPRLDDETFDALATAAARLSCPDDRFADFAAATGVACGELDDETSAGPLAEIDARVAHAWALTAEELDVVFADFSDAAVAPEYRERVRARLVELG